MRKVVQVGDCLIWQGCRNTDGYPKISRGSNCNIKGHRYVYEQVKGSIPEGLVIRHICDNILCLNPDHLIIGTPTDNMKDRVERGRTHNHLTNEQYEQIRELRRQGLSQDKVSKIVGCSQTQVSKMELGKCVLR